jgi:DNA-binding transcriptional regulator GbsR (MarR family)
VKSVPDFGTEAYITEMDRILSDLNTMRRTLKKGDRKERFTISKAMESIKYLQTKARRYGIKTGLLEDDSCD